MATPSWLDDAAAFATCATLTTTGSALVGTGVSTLWAGGGGLVPLSLGMLSFLAAGAACNNTPVDGQDVLPEVGGCQKLQPGQYGWLQIKLQGQDWIDVIPTGFNSKANQCNEITQIDTVHLINNNPPVWRTTVTFESTGTSGPQLSSAQFDFSLESEAKATSFRIRPLEGQSCAFGPTDPTPLPPNFTDPVQYTDASTNCNYNISPQGFVQESEGGGAGMVFKIEAAAPAVRAGGGVVGGCNFEPTLVYQPPGGGPPTTTPWDPTWPDGGGGGTPPWLAALIGAAGGAAATAIDNALAEIFETPLPAGNKTIYAACEYKEDGSKEEFTVNFPEENFNNRVLTALNAITDFQQQILYWKTPICSGAPQPLTGDPVSINWVSDEYSPNGNNRIRKLLTYFDQKNTSLADTVAHWKDFTWDAGPVIVSCVGTPLGKPQVWAVSVDEAKRVINHAAAIAGVDTTNAQWLVAPPKSARFGMQGKMRVHRGANGALGITKRDGPNGLPPALT